LTRRALRRGLENPIDREQLILEKQTKAREMLNASGLTDQRDCLAYRMAGGFRY
jgi:hypothetical protein